MKPASQPPLLERTTTTTPVGNTFHEQTFQPLPNPDMASVPVPPEKAPIECQAAPHSPARASSESQNLEIPPSPLPLPEYEPESIAPEPTCENLNPEYPVLHLLASAVLASEMANSVVPESEPANMCPSTCDEIPSEHLTAAPLQPPSPHVENLHRHTPYPNSLNHETGTVSCPVRDKSADMLSCKTIPPANKIASDPALKKIRTTRKTSKPRCENQSPVQRRPRTKRKPRTETVPPANQITRKPPLKKTRTMCQTPQTDCENQSPVQKRPRTRRKPPTAKKPQTMHKTADQPDTNGSPNRELEMDTSQIETNEMAPPESDTRHSQTPSPIENRTQDTPSVQHMIPISVYAGGEVQFNQTGPEYSIPPMFTFAGTQQTTFEDVKSEIYNCLKLSEDQFSLNIQARYNVVQTGPFFFTLLAINDDRAWRMIYEMAVSGMNWRVIELYVKLVQNQSSQNASPDLTLSHGASSMPQRSTLMHAIPSQSAPCNSPVVSSFQYSIPGIFNRFTQGQGPSPSELKEVIPFADEGSFPANQTFKSKKHLWFAITDLHMKENIAITVTSSCESELVVRCKNKRCQWKLHAIPTRVCSNWTIKTCFYPHTCHEATSKHIQAELTVEIIARMIRFHIIQGLELNIIKLHELVLKLLPGEHASYNNLWHARKILIKELFGNWEESYALLPRLFEAIKASNPKTKFDLQSDSMTQSGNQQFNRVAWAFGPCINAYHFLRPVISVKALSLLGTYDGRLLIACGYDAENQPVPLAFALVNEDTKSNWTWFMRFLRKEVICHNQLVCVISDCDGCIKNAFEGPYSYMDKAMLQVVHRFCSQNIADCLSKVCKDIELIDLFKSAAKKTSPQKFEEGRNAIKFRSPETYLYLERLGKRKPQDQFEQSTIVKWALYEDNGCRYGIMNNNCSETVKKVFKGCRHLPVAAIVENTFSNCMRWFSKRRQNVAEQVDAGKVRPDTVTGILKKRGDKAQGYDVKLYCSVFNRRIYEVVVKPTRDHGSAFLKYNVTVANRSTPECECRKLKFTGIPCSHVIAVCRKQKVDPKRFIHSYYSLQMLVDTWSADFHLYKNQTEWPEYNGAVIVPDKTLLQTRPKARDSQR